MTAPRSPLALATIALMAGCQAPAPMDDALFGSATDATTPLDAPDARPFLIRSTKPATRSFAVIGGEHDGATRRLESKRTTDDTILLRRSIEGADRPESVQRFKVNAGGDLVSTRETNIARDVITDFDPPLVVFPASLAPGSPFTQSLEFIIHPIDDPEKIKERGKAEVRIALVGAQTINLPSGPVETLNVRTTLKIDFGPARVERTGNEWLIAGAGLVAESYDEKVIILGVTSEHRRETMHALEEPPSIEE